MEELLSGTAARLLFSFLSRPFKPLLAKSYTTGGMLYEDLKTDDVLVMSSERREGRRVQLPRIADLQRPRTGDDSTSISLPAPATDVHGRRASYFP